MQCMWTNFKIPSYQLSIIYINVEVSKLLALLHDDMKANDTKKKEIESGKMEFPSFSTKIAFLEKTLFYCLELKCFAKSLLRDNYRNSLIFLSSSVHAFSELDHSYQVPLPDYTDSFVIPEKR